MEHQTIIVGGGLAGLACARHLIDAGISCCVLESGSEIGGRVQSEEYEGFLLDRGFQVLLTAYPEAQRLLDYEQLELCRFEPGALIYFDGKMHQLSDPWRRPQQMLSTALSPAATIRDKLRLAKFRSKTTSGELDDLYQQPEQAAHELLRECGFSETITERFFRPFLGGVFLDGQLETSSRMAEFVFRMFALGDAAVPAAGMREIPRQLARHLPENCIRTESRVETIDENSDSVRLASGEQLHAEAIVLATDAPTARRLLNDPFPASGQSVTCLYFAAPEPPVEKPLLVLNGEEHGPINNLAVMSQIASGYAPNDQALISISVLGGETGDEALRESVSRQLTKWFGSAVSGWRHLKTYHIPYALPVQSPPALDPVAKPCQVRRSVFICGDHCDTGSINGAFASARRAADAVSSLLKAG